MRAAILAVGSEMLGASRLDTNSLTITKMLDQYGIELIRKGVCADDRGEIASTLLFHLDVADVVVITGGLGPTEDDVTKEAVAQALGLELVLDNEVLSRIEQLFAARGLAMPKVNSRQAMVFRGQKIVQNFRGTAPGFHLNVTHNGEARHIWIFPGVPMELAGMLERDFEPWLATTRQASTFHRVLRVAGISESGVDEKLGPYYSKYQGELLTILASKGEIEIHLRARGSADEAYAHINEREEEIRALLGDRVYGLDDETLESVVGKLLLTRAQTLATAESCTGGLLGSRVTDVSGSSAYYMGGVVSYSRAAKLSLLGVDPALVEEHGEVSEPVAKAMAEGVRARFDATWGIGITGIAGPTGGTPAKPVGTVHIAVAGPEGAEHRPLMFRGTREMIKWFSTQSALDLLRRKLLE